MSKRNIGISDLYCREEFVRKVPSLFCLSFCVALEYNQTQYIEPYREVIQHKEKIWITRTNGLCRDNWLSKKQRLSETDDFTLYFNQETDHYEKRNPILFVEPAVTIVVVPIAHEQQRWKQSRN